MVTTTGGSPPRPTTHPSSSTSAGRPRSNDQVLADGGLDQLVHMAHPDGRHASLRRLVCALIEKYGPHTGLADLLPEAVDGRVGDAWPAGWRPKAGQYHIADRRSRHRQWRARRIRSGRPCLEPQLRSPAARKQVKTEAAGLEIRRAESPQ